MKFIRTATAVLAIALSVVISASAEVRREFAGGWYCEAQTNGSYAVAIRGSHIDSSAGRVDFPEGVDGLFLRTSPDGSKIAIGGSNDIAFEYAQGIWTVKGPSFGANPVVYQPSGTLVVVFGPGPTGSQGYRYVADDGRLVTGDESYADASRHIWEYTTRGDITCGQGGDEEGLQCLVAGRRVLVEPGVNRRIVFNRSGNQLAFCSAKLTEKKSVAIWMTAEELASKPTYEIPSGPVTPPPPPPPPVDPPSSPVECGSLPQPVQSILKAFGERYPELRKGDDDQRREFTLKLAEQLAFSVSPEWGTKRADPGRPQSKDSISIVRNGRLCNWDIINGSTREVMPDAHGEDITGQVFIPVVGTDHLGGTVPPPPPPPSVDIEALQARIAELEATVAAQAAANQTANLRIVELEQTVDEQLKEIERLRNVPEKECEVTGAPGWLKSLFGIGCIVRQK